MPQIMRPIAKQKKKERKGEKKHKRDSVIAEKAKKRTEFKGNDSECRRKAKAKNLACREKEGVINCFYINEFSLFISCFSPQSMPNV